MAATPGYITALGVFLCFVRFTCTTQPSILIAPSDVVVVLRGEHATSLRLHCFVIGYQPQMTVSWYKDGQYISNNVQLIGDRVDPERYSVYHPDGGGLFTLIIEEVTTATADKDGGMYRCIVKGEKETVLIQTPLAEVQVSVDGDEDYPQCSSDRPPANVTDGSVVKLRCYSDIALEWSRNDRNTSLQATNRGILAGGLHFADYSLTISAEDEGTTFTCGAAQQSDLPYKTCGVGPFILSPKGPTGEQGLTSIHIIAIAIGGTLILAAVVILLVVILFKVRQKRKFDRILKRTRDFGWQTSPIDPTHELRNITNPRPTSRPLRSSLSGTEGTYVERTSWKSSQPDVIFTEREPFKHSQGSLAKSDTSTRRRSTDLTPHDSEPDVADPRDVDNDYENVQPLMDEINEHFMMLNNTIEL